MASDEYQDYQEMEERLYAQIHHDHQRSSGENDRQFSQPRFPQQQQQPHNNQPNYNRGRYWAAPNNDDSYQQQQPQRRNNNHQFDRRRENPPQNRGNGRRDFRNRQSGQYPDKDSSNRRTPPRNFTIGRYQTVAGGAKQFEKRTQSNNFPLKKKGPIKGVNPFNVANQEKVRLENKIRLMQKIKKARQRIQSNQSSFKVPELPSTSRAHSSSSNQSKKVAKKITTPVNTKVIFVDSCSDSESLDGSLIEPKDIKEEKTEVVDLNASQDDDVIMIPTPAPEIVSLIDSDEDSQGFETKKTKEPGSRCVSPSNSSILSDDFIGQSDRSRLQSEFLFVLPEDEDVQTNVANKSTSSDDSNHSDDTTFPIGASQMMPKSVGDLGNFILRGAAVENSLQDKDSNQFANAEGDEDSDESEKEEEPEPGPIIDEVQVVETQNDVIDLSELTQEEQPSTSRKRTLSNRSSECDIMLNISSKRRSKSVSEVNTQANASFEKEVLTIQVDDDEDEPRKLDPEIGWNKEMKRYYYESWGGEQFQLRRILSGMCPDRKNWRIDMSDKYPPAPIKMRNRCRNCQEFSHKVQHCPLPKRRIVCHMCGEDGHREPRCPNSICLTCGSRQNQFMRYCRKCNDNRRKRCSLCGIRGHIFALCPDKWRRYHNTIEDNVELNKTYIDNRSLWCSVCSSNKHQAHNCLQAETEMGRFLPSVKTVSYLPWYKLDLKAPKVVNATDYSMMSFAKDVSFNWSLAVTENDHGFYNRFKEITGIMTEEINKEVESELKRVRRRKKSRKSEENEVEELEMSHIDIDLNDSQESIVLDTNLNNFSFTKEMEKITDQPFQLNLEQKRDPRLEDVEPVVFVDQRKEISELAERIGVTEEEIMSVRAPKFPIETEEGQELDFIPLDSNPTEANEVQPVVPIVEEKVDAKVFLTKEHSKYLLNEGEAFLHKASQKYDLQLRVVWENIGNMLQMHGLQSNQNAFYNELSDFLQHVSLDDHIKSRNNAFSMPKVKEKLMKFIEEHLSRLKMDKKSLPHLKDLIRKMNVHQRNKQYKSADKMRRQLNTFLLGKHGLRDGKTHLIGILKQYQSIRDNKPGCESHEFRDTLRNHFLYLFTAFDHENYEGLLADYEECIQSGNWPLPLRALFNLGNMIRMANGENIYAPSVKNASNEEQPSTSKDSSSLFFEDSIGVRFIFGDDISHHQEASVESPPEETDISEPSKTVETENSAVQETPIEIIEESSESPVEVEMLPESPLPVILPPKTPEKAVNPPSTPQKGNNFSEASRKIISEAMNLFSLMNNQKAISKLKLVEQKATHNQITEEDYQSLLHIQKIVQSKMGAEKS